MAKQGGVRELSPTVGGSDDATTQRSIHNDLMVVALVVHCEIPPSGLQLDFWLDLIAQ
jgi:hypothetical protein